MIDMSYYVQIVFIRIFGYQAICGGVFACAPYLYLPLIGLGLFLGGVATFVFNLIFSFIKAKPKLSKIETKQG